MSISRNDWCAAIFRTYPSAGKGSLYKIETRYGCFKLRDFARETANGSRWTIDVPGEVFGKDWTDEMKFR